MNERIKELAQQAGCSIDGMGYGEGNVEKFAELIIRECIGCCEQVISEKLPHIWDGSNWPADQERPDLFEPLETFINRRAKECADATAAYLSA